MESLSSTRIDLASNYAQCLELIKMQTIFQLPKMWLPFRVLVISSKASYACLHQRVDESMACRHLKSPQSLPDISLHLILVTIVSWSWITLFCSMSIDPPIPKIRLFQNLTFKIQVQGYGQGKTQWLRVLHRIQSMCFLFILWPSEHFL